MNAIANRLTLVHPPSYADTRDCSEVVADANTLCDRVTAAMPGEAITYFVGLLARDRDRLASSLLPEQRIELNAIAACAWRLAEAGWGHLVQRRVAEDRFAYLLIVRPRPRSARSAAGMALVQALQMEAA